MKIEINMLNVNDGDAIIVELKKKDKSLVMVIDSGHSDSYTAILKPKLQEILAKHKVWWKTFLGPGPMMMILP